jgi:hypothetical protein
MLQTGSSEIGFPALTGDRLCTLNDRSQIWTPDQPSDKRIVDLPYRVFSNWLGQCLTARLVALVLAAVLVACTSGNDSAVLGPNPGGGFYCPHNAFIGCAYP